MELSIGLAVAAGFISFISPCVLPLVPAYITYMGGRVTNTVAAQAGAGGGQVSAGSGALMRLNTGLHSVFFVLGFSAVFVGIGLLSTAFVRQVGGSNVSALTQIIGRVGGIVIIVFGLHFMDRLSWLFNQVRARKEAINLVSSIMVAVLGSALIFWAFDRPPSAFAENTNLFDRLVVSLPVFTAFIVWLGLGGALTKPRAFWLKTMEQIEFSLYADTRKDMSNTGGGNGFGSSALMGVVFAAGWTPCIGPIYGAILTLAANGGSVTTAGTMLGAYSLGLGIPFIVTALALDGAQGWLRSLNQHMGTIKLVSGSFLILIGVLVASGQLQRLSTLGSQGQLGEISFRMEECFTSAVAGDVAWGQVIACVNEDPDLTTTTTGAAVSEELPGAAGVQPLSIEGAAANAPAADGDASATSDIVVGTNVGETAPNFTTTTPDGREIALEDYRGEVILLNFWATWCGPCRIEMPEFQDAYLEHQDNGFTILAVNFQERPEQITPFVEELGLTFPIAMDQRGDINTQFNVLSYPSTYLIGRDGEILDRHFGPLTADAVNEMIGSAF
jgi:cytochrome c biogenesis protein CcdA/peroxiredoxin